MSKENNKESNKEFEEWWAEQDVAGLGPGYKEIAQKAWDAGFNDGWVAAVEAYNPLDL